jgi:hypothetical protein
MDETCHIMSLMFIVLKNSSIMTLMLLVIFIIYDKNISHKLSHNICNVKYKNYYFVIIIYLCPISMKKHWLDTTIGILNKCITLYNDKMDNYIMTYNVHKISKACTLLHITTLQINQNTTNHWGG